MVGGVREWCRTWNGSWGWKRSAHNLKFRVTKVMESGMRTVDYNQERGHF